MWIAIGGIISLIGVVVAWWIGKNRLISGLEEMEVEAHELQVAFARAVATHDHLLATRLQEQRAGNAARIASRRRALRRMGVSGF